MPGEELVITRVFDAPRELVFAAWTDPRHVAQWWGPQGWTTPVCEIDLRPGGVWRYGMRSAEGQESWSEAVYREIDPPQRLVYADTFTDAQGRPLEGMPRMLVTVTFEALGGPQGHGAPQGRTRLTIRTRPATPAELRALLDMGIVQGLNEALDRLAAHLAPS
ncbi:MAG TPA: SRPBCC domain-containing protein [Chloroflexota bacterium]|nr:SRPBCC domain-containing protein [Chloroflexota bacterium]